MDVFGHAALSLLVGRAVAPDPTLRRATTVAALSAGLLPDVDTVAYLWGAASFRQYHQLFTHNIVALVVLPALVALLCCVFVRTRRRWLFVAAYAGMGFHLLGDVIGLWPVPLLVPFSSWRFALFLLETDFSLVLDILLISGALATTWDPVAARVKSTRIVAAVTLAVAVIYLLL